MGVNLDLRIDHLVLPAGSPPAGEVAAAVERRLAALLAEPGAAAALGDSRDAARVDAGTIEAGPGTTAGALGARIADAVHRGIRP